MPDDVGSSCKAHKSTTSL